MLNRYSHLYPQYTDEYTVHYETVLDIVSNIDNVDTLRSVTNLFTLLALYYEKRNIDVQNKLYSIWNRLKTASNDRITTASVYYLLYHDEILSKIDWYSVFSDQYTNVELTNYSEVYTAYPMSNEGGMSIECILNSDMQYIYHFTRIEYIESILDSSALISPKIILNDEQKNQFITTGYIPNSNIRLDQYPGIYTRIRSQYDAEMHELLSDETVLLIFSLTPLRGRNWYVNLIEDYGLIGSTTYDSYTFPKHYYRLSDKLEDAELVIQNRLPLEYLQYIVVSDRHYSTVKSSTSHTVLTLSEFNNLTITKLTEGLYDEYIGSTEPVDLRYHNTTEYHNYTLDMNNVYSTLLNYGYSRDGARDIITDYSNEQILELLRQLWVDSLDTGPGYVAVHPPY